MVRFAEKLDND